MGNPKAPKSRRPLNDAGDLRAEFAHRLELAGAASDVIVAAMRAWDEEPAYRDDVALLTGDELAREVASVEDDWSRGHDDGADEAARAVLAEAEQVCEGEENDVLTWIEADPTTPARALAVELVEATGQRRPLVLEWCETVTADA